MFIIERRNCPVCLEECNFNSIVLPCKHQYHSECLKSQINSNINKCAECSREYNFSKNGDAILITYFSDKFISCLNKYLDYFIIITITIVAFIFGLLILICFLLLPIGYIFSLNMRLKIPYDNEAEDLLMTGRYFLTIELVLLLFFILRMLFFKCVNIFKWCYLLTFQRNLEKLNDIENQM